jgi:hypothetical protein
MARNMLVSVKTLVARFGTPGSLLDADDEWDKIGAQIEQLRLIL